MSGLFALVRVARDLFAVLSRFGVRGGVLALVRGRIGPVRSLVVHSCSWGACSCVFVLLWGARGPPQLKDSG